MKQDFYFKFKEAFAMKRIHCLISFLLAVFMIFSSHFGFAAQYDLKTMTPQISQALKNRQARYPQLQQMKKAGLVGENNQGYVESLAQQTNTIVSAENADRRIIYQALVDQNSLGPNGMREVQRAFAEVQREKAVFGEKVQSPSGDWILVS